MRQGHNYREYNAGIAVGLPSHRLPWVLRQHNSHNPGDEICLSYSFSIRMQTSELVRRGITELTAAGVADCHTDIYLLLGRCLGKSRTQLLLAAREEVPAAAELEFEAMLCRRKRREPLAYILGEQEFWSRAFHVSPAVLIPRPETEFLLELVFSAGRRGELPLNGPVLDVCCGSGVIAIIVALELRRQVIGIDLSSAALEVSRKNCLRHDVEGLVSLMRSDLLSAILPERRVALVLSNPPYVSSRAIRSELEPEVGKHEPLLALDGGEDGLDLISRLRDDLPRVLAPGGQVFMEIGHDQGPAVAEMFTAHRSGLSDFQTIHILKDYAGRDRVLHARIS